MLTDASLAGPVPPEGVYLNRRRPAVVASLLLHAGPALVFGLLAPAPAPIPDKGSDTPAVRITLVSRSPQASESTPLASDPEQARTETLTTPTVSLPDTSSLPDSFAPAVAEANLAPQPADADTANEADAAPEIVLDRDQLREAISSSMLSYRREVREQGLQDCQRYRERYNRWDCPQPSEVRPPELEKFDGVRVRGPRTSMLMRYFFYAPESLESVELRAEMDSLRSLMEDDGMQGGLARQRYYINAERVCTLNAGRCERGTTMRTYSRFAGDPQ